MDYEEEGETRVTSPLLGRDRSDSLARSYASISTIGANRGRPERSSSRYNTVERIAANITTAAEQLADRGRDSSPKFAVTGDDMDEEVAGAMLASMYSDRSALSVASNGSKGKARRSQSKRKSVTFTSAVEQEEEERGRSSEAVRTSEALVTSPVDERARLPTWSHSRSRGRQSKSRRSTTASASIVFMGVWTLFGIGKLQAPSATPELTLYPVPSQYGRVLQPLPDTLSLGNPSYMAHIHTSQPLLTRPLLFVSNPSHSKSSLGTLDHVEGPLDPQPPKQPKVNTEQIIGRIFAWVCTTFYLTCRMPQIWKNVGI